MLLDLLALAVIGGILEVFITKISAQLFVLTPCFTIGLFIVFLGIVRWNLWGLLLVPAMVACNKIGGSLIKYDFLKEVYDWRFILSSCLGYLVLGLNVILYKEHKTSKYVDNTLLLILLVAVDYLLFCLIQFMTYRLLFTGNILEPGKKMYSYIISSTGEAKELNLCSYGESGFVSNILGLAVTLVGLFILRSQGIVKNQNDKLVEDKENARRAYESSLEFNLNNDEEDQNANNDSEKNQI